MDFLSLVPVFALLVAAVVIAFLLLRIMRSRRPAAEPPRAPAAVPGAAPAQTEDEYLDSSHIISGGPVAAAEAAARAAEALHKAGGKRK